jgi:hypothetical protein
VIGRKTQRRRTTEIWFVYEENKIYLLGLPSSQWWRNLKVNPMIEISIKGNRVKTITTFANSKREHVKELFVRKYGVDQIKRWYGTDLSHWPVIEINLNNYVE